MCTNPLFLGKPRLFWSSRGNAQVCGRKSHIPGLITRSVDEYELQKKELNKHARIYLSNVRVNKLMKLMTQQKQKTFH
jgi:hypothetical protein